MKNILLLCKIINLPYFKFSIFHNFDLPVRYVQILLNYNSEFLLQHFMYLIMLVYKFVWSISLRQTYQQIPIFRLFKTFGAIIFMMLVTAYVWFQTDKYTRRWTKLVYLIHRQSTFLGFSFEVSKGLMVKPSIRNI